jgi:hypothetical protein
MKKYSLIDVKNMIKENRKILLVKNNIYDVTNFDHPFNITPYDSKLGNDVSVDYNFHSKESKKVWDKYKIGTLITNNIWCIIS